MYQPNFCNECGERIQRAEWHWWTSRKFCAECAPRFNRRRLAAAAVAGLALFGGGALTGRIAQTPPKPLVIEHSLVAAQTPNVNAPRGNLANSNLRPAPQTGSNAPLASGDTRDASVTTPAEEAVYICGALTKKGNPCSRRVRGGDVPSRCWQHKGMPAVLPPDKLRIRE